MKAIEAYKHLNPQTWANTDILTRLSILEQLRDNMKTYAHELGEANSKMKNELIGSEAYSIADGMMQSIGPVASAITASINLYEALAHGEMPKPISIKQVDENRYDVEVFPIYPKDKLTAGKQKGYLRVLGKPVQTNPMNKPSGVVAVSGAGNYTSSLECIKAIFYDNKVVLHKAHKLNEASDKVWEKIFAPLFEAKAMSFVDVNQSRDMVALEGLDAIYFTGSTDVAKTIMSNAKAPLVSECGGNNPCLIVPSVRPWTDKEIKHQAENLVSMSKANGGAACGRPQTIITSKNWPQRLQFLDAVRKAIVEDTYAVGTYYPGSDEKKENFLKNHPNAEVLKPENGKHPKSDYVFITDVKADDYAIKNEAFCQITDEIQLDTENNATDFLAKATAFCNEKLTGTLGCMILIDNDTHKENQQALDKALLDLNYGGITVNGTPPLVFLNAYLTWGGCNETEETFVSGIGNFGNPFCFENVEKSILIDDFNAPAFSLTNKKASEHLYKNMVEFSIENSWGKLMKMAGTMMVDNLRKKDF